MADDDGAYGNDDAMGGGGQSDKVCKVYDADDFFTIFVQLLLAFFGLLSLWFKRQGEVPRRKFRTWFLDVSKQGLGACYAHILNMIIASKIVSKGGDTSLNDQCAWYGMTYLADTTLGLILAIWGLTAIDWLANSYDWVSLKHSGVYEGVDGFLHWMHQACAWLFILTVVKVIIYFFMLWASDALAYVGGFLFRPLQGNIRFELLFVMIAFPGLLNVIYFWIADHYLKAGAEHAGAHEIETLDTELAKRKESLLTETEKADSADPKLTGNGDKDQLEATEGNIV